ncbi:DUF4283 domain-containing protein [Cephalotus follicularis]|uniref:DUF4283 domain-containing protein n=1 Tax=Cephalotus follicularis TaxID=3775 RepID=A0A1Q3D4Q1_CEPFO|nr:DUF4283 domain-containing protein [Cephalotus follicularis]
MAELSAEVLVEGAKEWEHSLVGFFVGKRIPFCSMQDALNKKWSAACKFSIHIADNGIFVFKCESSVVRDWILENGPWDVWGVHLVLRLWERDIPPIRSGFTKIPVWVKFMNIPMEYWTSRGRSHLASVLGSPIHMDSATEEKTRICFARICVEMNADKPFPEVIKAKRMNGTIVEVRVDYSWKPPVCERCKVFDHSTRGCPIKYSIILVAPIIKGAPDAEGSVEVKRRGKEKMVPESEPMLVADPSPTAVPTSVQKPCSKPGCADPPRNPEVSKIPDKEKNPTVESPEIIEHQIHMDLTDRRNRVNNQVGGSSSSSMMKKKGPLTAKSRNLGKGYLPQAIHGEISLGGKLGVCVSIVYGDCDYLLRRDLVTKAGSFAARSWIVFGDFNVSRFSHEYNGGRLVVSRVMKEFEECIQACQIENLKQSWHCFNTLSHLQAHFPESGISDHSPAVLQLQEVKSPVGRHFKYLNVWGSHPTFASVV